MTWKLEFYDWSITAVFTILFVGSVLFPMILKPLDYWTGIIIGISVTVVSIIFCLVVPFYKDWRKHLVIDRCES